MSIGSFFNKFFVFISSGNYGKPTTETFGTLKQTTSGNSRERFLAYRLGEMFKENKSGHNNECNYSSIDSNAKNAKEQIVTIWINSYSSDLFGSSTKDEINKFKDKLIKENPYENDNNGEKYIKLLISAYCWGNKKEKLEDPIKKKLVTDILTFNKYLRDNTAAQILDVTKQIKPAEPSQDSNNKEQELEWKKKYEELEAKLKEQKGNPEEIEKLRKELKETKEHALEASYAAAKEIYDEMTKLMPKTTINTKTVAKAFPGYPTPEKGIDIMSKYFSENESAQTTDANQPVVCKYFPSTVMKKYEDGLSFSVYAGQKLDDAMEKFSEWADENDLSGDPIAIWKEDFEKTATPEMVRIKWTPYYKTKIDDFEKFWSPKWDKFCDDAEANKGAPTDLNLASIFLEFLNTYSQNKEIQKKYNGILNEIKENEKQNFYDIYTDTKTMFDYLVSEAEKSADELPRVPAGNTKPYANYKKRLQRKYSSSGFRTSGFKLTTDGTELLSDLFLNGTLNNIISTNDTLSTNKENWCIVRLKFDVELAKPQDEDYITSGNLQILGESDESSEKLYALRFTFKNIQVQLFCEKGAPKFEMSGPKTVKIRIGETFNVITFPDLNIENFPVIVRRATNGNIMAFYKDNKPIGYDQGFELPSYNNSQADLPHKIFDYMAAFPVKDSSFTEDKLISPGIKWAEHFYNSFPKAHRFTSLHTTYNNNVYHIWPDLPEYHNLFTGDQPPINESLKHKLNKCHFLISKNNQQVPQDLLLSPPPGQQTKLSDNLIWEFVTIVPSAEKYTFTFDPNNRKIKCGNNSVDHDGQLPQYRSVKATILGNDTELRFCSNVHYKKKLIKNIIANLKDNQYAVSINFVDGTSKSTIFGPESKLEVSSSPEVVPQTFEELQAFLTAMEENLNS